MSYTHLSQETRYQIQGLREGGWSLREIGKQVSRDPSTITVASSTETQATKATLRSRRIGRASSAGMPRARNRALMPING